MAPGGGSSPTRPAATARLTRAMISGRASSVPATRWRKRSTAWSVTATSTRDRPLQLASGADLDRAGHGLALGAVRRPPVPRVERAVVMVLGERPQQRAGVTAAAHDVLGVAQQRAVDVAAVRPVLVEQLRRDVQDPDLA